jgi:hypothetical protein
MAQRNRGPSGPKLRLAVCVETFHYVEVGEFRQMTGNRLRQVDLALFHQLQSGRRSDRLGHRRDRENAVDVDCDA